MSYVCEYTIDALNPNGDNAGCGEPAHSTIVGPRCEAHAWAERGEQAVRAYAAGQDGYTDDDEAARDLISDVLHYLAVTNSVVFNHVRMAIERFEEEQRGEVA